MGDEMKKKILLVEDEAIIAIAQKKTLERYGYTIITAGSSDKALEVFRANTDISLVLMDIDLGQSADGTETAKIMLEERELPVVFLSSHTEPEIVEKTEKITSYGYVVKNSGITVLDASIKMAFKLFNANKLIADSEIKQKAMISNISDVIGIIGSDGMMKYKSPNIERWFGWKPEDLIGTDGMLTVHPDDLERVKQVFYSLLEKDNSSKTIEYRYKCKDGSYRQIELTATSLINDPVVNGVLLNYHDISERKKIEETLSESEKRYRGLLKNIGAGVVVHKPDTSIVFYNSRALELLGLTEDQISGRNAMDPGWKFLSELTTSLPIEEYPVNRVLAAKKPVKNLVIGINRPASNDIVWVVANGFPVIDNNGEISEIIINFIDFTDRKAIENERKLKNEELKALNEEMEAANEELIAINEELTATDKKLRRAMEDLRESEERFRRIFEEGQFGIVIVNKEFRFEDVNPAFCSFTGYSRYELLSMTFKDITHPDFLKQDIENLQKLKNGEIPFYQTEKKYIRKNGEECWGNILVSVVRDKDGEFFYNLALVMDITERKTAENALNEIEKTRSGLFEKLNEAQHVARIGSWEWDLKTDRIWWSDETYRIFGVSPDDFVPDFTENARFIHPDDINQYRELFENSFKTGEPLNYNFRLISGDGVSKYCNARGQINYDSAGQPVRFIGTVHDITDLRQAEIEVTAKNEELNALNEELSAAFEEMEAANNELLRTNDELSAKDEKIRQTMDLLRDREARLQTLLKTIPDLVWLKDKDGVYLSCNKQFERFFGAREAEITGRTDYDFMDRELAEFFRDHDRRAMEAGKPTINEEWITYADDGHRAYLETIKTPMYDDNGKLIGVLGIGRDITVRKQAREDLLRGEERYLKAQRIGHVGNWEYNLQTTNFWGSDEARRIYGFDSEQFDFTTDEVESCIPEREKVHQALIDLIENGKDYNLEFEIHPRNGSEPRIIWSIAELQRDENGNPLIVAGVIQDITDRKRFENELKIKNEELTAAIEEMEAANEELLAVSEDLHAKEKALIIQKNFTEALLECIPGYLYVYDERGNLIRWNKKHETMTGYSAEELSRMNMSDWFEGEDAVRVAAAVDEVFRTGYGEVEANLLIKGGGKLLIHSNGVRLTIDGKTYFTGVGVDISERKRMEEELIQSRHTLDTMLQTMADGMLTVDLSGRIVYSNQAAGRILGIGKDVLGRDYKSRDWRQLDENGDPYPLDQLPLAVAMREKRVVLDIEHQIEALDGERKWLSVNAAPLFDEAGQLTGGIASFREITENKRLIEEMNRNRRRFEQLIKNSSDVIVILDAAGNQLFVSDVVEKILGYKPEELINIPVIRDMIHPEDQEKTQAAFLDIISKGYGGTRYRHRHKNGGWIYLEGWGTNQLENPDIRGVVVNVRDITERKLFEDEIRLDEARLESLLKINQHPVESIQDLLDFTLGEAIVLTGSKIGYIYFYDESKKEFILNTWSKDVMQRCAVVEKQTVYQLEKTGLWGEAVRQRRPIMENDFLAPNPLRKGLPEGHNPLTRFLTIPVISNEEIVAVVGVANKESDYNDSDIRQLNLMMDAVWRIVQRKKADEQLRETRDYLDNLLNYANAPIIVWDNQFRITKFNKAFERLSGRSESDVLGKEVDILFPPGTRGQSMEYIKNASAGNRWEVVEIEIQHTDGTVRTLLWNSAVVYSQDGSNIMATIAQGQDITERKIAEENIQKLLREKELILQEVHHRIKNNMNTIKGLLNLQADAQETPEIANVLFDAESRVISMMVLYDRLYRSDGYESISIKNYLPALMDEILSNFPSGKPVKIVRKLDDFALDVKILQPLGIIVNELLTNIMKYAFIDRENGVITVSSEITGNHAVITIQDNGVGIPESIQIENSTGFGMQLVSMLTEQIGGAIRIERGNGTKFILEFDL